MKVLIASGSFKDVWTPDEACKVIETALKSIPLNGIDKITRLPLADGGENSDEVVLANFGAGRVIIDICGPDGQNRKVGLVRTKDNEIYVASYLALALTKSKETKQNPLDLSSYGLGQMLVAAARLNPKRIILGLGGSHTVDAGIGLAQALGAEFFDNEGRLRGTEKQLIANDLESISQMRTNKVIDEIKNIPITVLCDSQISVRDMFTPIDNNATEKKISRYYDSQRINITKILKKMVYKFTFDNFPSSILNLAGYGNAGGVLLCLSKICQISLSSGVEFFLERMSVGDKILANDLVITGEGKFDNTSIKGKTGIGVTKLAAKLGRRTVYVCGLNLVRGQRILRQLGIDFLVTSEDYSTKIPKDKALTLALTIAWPDIYNKYKK